MECLKDLKIKNGNCLIIFLEKYLTFKKSQNFRKLFSKKSCAKIFELEKIFFLSAKKFEIFVESQNTWKPRKSQFSAQSDFSETNGDHIHFVTKRLYSLFFQSTVRIIGLQQASGSKEGAVPTL